MLSNKDNKFINLAATEAHNSPCLMRHGCIAVKNGKIIGRGHNSYRSSSKDGFISNCMTCHAEIAAIREVHKKNYNFKKVVLYVVRLDANNDLQESGPCVDCMNQIQKLNIKRVIHSTSGGKVEKIKPINFVSKHITNGKKILIQM